MKQVYQADDGTIFDTEASCKAYENDDTLHAIIEEHINVSFYDDVGFHCIEVDDVKTFIEQNIDDIIRIVKGEAVTGTTCEGRGWISNEGNSSGSRPDGVSGSTLVEIKYRNGREDTDYVNNWCRSWCSTNDSPLDIVAYRIVT